MGVKFDSQWTERLKNSLEGQQRARAAEREAKSRAEALTGYAEDCDENFAFIAGYTSGGYPYGVTLEELEIREQEQRPDREPDPSDEQKH